MKKFILTLALLFGLATIYTPLAQACGKCGGGEWKKQSQCKISKIKKKMKMLWIHKDYLELTEKQMGQLKDIKHAAMKEIIRLKAEKDIIKVDLKTEMWKETIDVDKVNGLVDQKYGVKTQIAKVYVKAVADIKQVLNEEQRKKALEIAITAKLIGVCPVAGCKSCHMSSGGKVCPLTGKPLGAKGSGSGMKGSGKGSM